MGSTSITHWLILLAVIVLVFGTAKFRNAGKDLGAAVRGFKDAMKDGDPKKTPDNITHDTIEGKATRTSDHEHKV